MKTKIAALIPMILLSVFFFIHERGGAPGKASDFRDAPRDTTAVNSLKAQNPGGSIEIPGPVTPEGIDDRVSAGGQQGNASVPDSGAALKHGPTSQQAQAMLLHNKGLFKSFAKSLEADRPVQVKYRPYADYEKTGYLIMSSLFTFNSQKAKFEMAKILPEDAVLVIFTNSSSQQAKEEILGTYGPIVPRSRIKVVSLPGGDRGFWARDGIPVPMFDQNNKFTVIDAAYYYQFEADKEVSRLFNAGYEKHEYYYEGGNFQVNSKGDCVIVNNDRHAKIPDAIFAGYYGCKQLIRLPFIDGIGHVDERARFINDTTLVTDTPSYKDILTGKGFTVRMLPRPAKPMETYVNSLIMDGKVVMPVFNEPTDAAALAVYESLGLKASGGDSISLSNNGMGSVHCITMTYPKVPMAELMKALGGKEI